MADRISKLPASAPQGAEAWRQPAQTVNRLIDQTQPFHIKTITSSDTADGVYGFYLCDATGVAITVSLPQASAYKGKRFYVKKIDSSVNTVTIAGYGSEKIDDSATQVIGAQYICLTVVSDGANWWIV